MEVKGIKVLAAVLEGADVAALRETMDKLRDKLKSAAIVLAAAGGKVSLIAGVTADTIGKVKAGELVNMPSPSRSAARAAAGRTWPRPAVHSRKTCRLRWPRSRPGRGQSNPNRTPIRGSPHRRKRSAGSALFQLAVPDAAGRLPDRCAAHKVGYSGRTESPPIGNLPFVVSSLASQGVSNHERLQPQLVVGVFWLCTSFGRIPVWVKNRLIDDFIEEVERWKREH